MGCCRNVQGQGVFFVCASSCLGAHAYCIHDCLVTSPSSNNMSTVYTQTRILNHALPMFLHCSITPFFSLLRSLFPWQPLILVLKSILHNCISECGYNLLCMCVCVCVCVLAEKELETAFLPARSIWLSILQFRSSESIFSLFLLVLPKSDGEMNIGFLNLEYSCLWLQGIEHPFL